MPGCLPWWSCGGRAKRVSVVDAGLASAQSVGDRGNVARADSAAAADPGWGEEAVEVGRVGPGVPDRVPTRCQPLGSRWKGGRDDLVAT
jgi:hypothetical protein